MLRCRSIQRERFLSATSFQAVFSIPLVGPKPIQCRQQKGSEFATPRLEAFQELFRKQPSKELLRQILGIFRPVADTPEIAVNRIPIDLAQLGQRSVSPCRLLQTGAKNDAPMGSLKPAMRGNPLLNIR